MNQSLPTYWPTVVVSEPVHFVFVEAMSREYVTEYQALPSSIGGGGEEGEDDVEEGQHAPLVVGNLRHEQNRCEFLNLYL